MFELYILVLQCVTIFTGLICLWRKGPFLLWVILSAKILAGINENIIVDHSKAWWGISRSVFYNLFSIFDITAWCIFFFLLFENGRLVRYLIVLFWIIVMIVKYIEIVQNSMNVFSVQSLTLFCGGSILFSMVYFLGVLKSDQHSLKSDYCFWLCCASVCFHPILMLNLLTLGDPSYWHDSFSTVTFDILQFIGISFYNIFICISFITFYRSRRSYRVNL
jgi:hypothetical protein